MLTLFFVLFLGNVPAGGFGGLQFDFQPPPASDPLAHWERFRNAPAPVPEEAALRLLPLLPDAARRRRFVEENFPDLAFFGGAQGAGRAVRWLLADSCLLPFRLALWLEYAAQLPPADQGLGHEILWDAIPGHPQAFEFLRAAIEAAIRAGREKDARRLEKVQFLFWPLSLSEERRREIRRTVPCPRRAMFVQAALGTGAADAVLESVAECPDPYAESLALYQKGEYARAWSVWQQVPARRRAEVLENRIAGMALSPSELIGRYRTLHEKTPSNTSLRRWVRTLLQFGFAGEAAAALGGNPDPAWRFLRGLSFWMAGRRTDALADWAAEPPGETLEERTARLYWLERSGGPAGLPPEPDPRKPILAYYLHLKKLQKMPAAPVDGVTRGLPVILRRESARGGALSSWLSGGRLAGSAAAVLALRPYDTDGRTQGCVQDLAAAGRARFRSLLDLWKCPHFVDGRPQLCPVTSGEFPTLPTAFIPDDAGNFMLMQMEGGLLPQPYAELVQKAAREFGLPKSLLWAVMQTESSFFPRVISGAGAVGLFQVIPPTGHEIARTLGREPFHAAQLLDPGTAVRFGAWYLRRLGDEFGENWALVAAAYNAGPHQVRRWVQRPEPWPTDAWVETIPFDETRRYVKLVVGRMVLFARQTGEPPPALPPAILTAPK